MPRGARLQTALKQTDCAGAGDEITKYEPFLPFGSPRAISMGGVRLALRWARKHHATPSPILLASSGLARTPSACLAPSQRCKAAREKSRGRLRRIPVEQLSLEATEERSPQLARVARVVGGTRRRDLLAEGGQGQQRAAKTEAARRARSLVARRVQDGASRVPFAALSACLRDVWWHHQRVGAAGGQGFGGWRTREALACRRAPSSARLGTSPCLWAARAVQGGRADDGFLLYRPCVTRCADTPLSRVRRARTTIRS